MISLTYVSTARQPFDAEALADLLEVSRRNNHATGLSGMMLYVGGHFIQTLEGPAATVDATCARISADPRHRDHVVASREVAPCRIFGDWSMRFEDLGLAKGTQLPGYNDFLSASTELERAADHLGRAGIFHRV